jgi:beta-aspartyl-peptidase (threonine type)
MGFEPCDLLTKEAHAVWKRRLCSEMPEEVVEKLADYPDLWRWVEVATDPELPKGTVNFIAQDSQGSICAGVSTSGWAWKYPGRLGDSPLVGAGLYADDRFGAVACTGMGEMAIRASTARSLVLYLQMGLSLEEAGRRAMADLNALGGRHLSRLRLVALDTAGRHAGFGTSEGWTYIYMTEEMVGPEEAPRAVFRTRQRWGDGEQE